MFFRAILPATHRAIVSNAHLHPQRSSPSKLGRKRAMGPRNLVGNRNQVNSGIRISWKKIFLFEHEQEVGVVLTEINFCPTS